jgi:hypothetical protein
MVFTIVVFYSLFGNVRRGSSTSQAHRQPHISCVTLQKVLFELIILAYIKQRNKYRVCYRFGILYQL